MTKPPRAFTRTALAALTSVAIGLGCASTSAQNINLPDLGSSANALISPQEAQDYGASMLRQMRALDMVVDDPLLDDYINDLGYRLVAACAKPKDHFAFFIAKDPEINAFAAPGGYIAVNSGLITATQNESELAAVMAHEIGHITQNHLQRAFEASKKDAPLMALVLLGAIAAGASNHSGDSPMAVLAGGQGLIAQRSINFTRKDEIEADRAGIKTLANAGFDPDAMANFFQRMEDLLSTDSGDQEPSFLQTHPVTTARISDAKSRAGALIAEQKQRAAIGAGDQGQWSQDLAPIPFVKDPAGLLAGASSKQRNRTWALMRERVRVLAGDAPKLVLYYRSNLQHTHGFDTAANHYGYALALARSGRGIPAIKQLQPLLKTDPDNLPLNLAMADARLQAGQRGAALALYSKLNDRSPHNRAVAVAYARALTGNGNKAQARQAAQLLRPLIQNAEEPEIYDAYARASDQAGDPVRGGEAFADASYYAGRPFDALEQLKRLLRRTDLDYYARARIQARIAELTPLVMELRKRRIDTVDNPATHGGQRLQSGDACDHRLCFGIGGAPDRVIDTTPPPYDPQAWPGNGRLAH